VHVWQQLWPYRWQASQDHSPSPLLQPWVDGRDWERRF